MKKVSLLFPVLFGLLFISSCGTINQKLNPGMKKVRGSKIVVEEERLLEDFSKVNIEMFSVVLVQDTVNKVRLSGEDNVLPEIHFKNENGVLSVNLTENMYMHINHQPVIYLHFKEIDEIFSDHGRYSTSGVIDVDKLHVQSSSGNFELILNVDTLSADLSGNGRCRGAVFASGDVGIADISLQVNARFDSPDLFGKECRIDFSEESYYRIKLKNWEEKNVLLPTNKPFGSHAADHLGDLF